MGNAPSTDDVEIRDTEVDIQPDVTALVRPPAEDHVEQDIIENLDTPFENDRFLPNIKSNYDEIKKDILKRSKEENKQCRFNDPAFPATDKSLYDEKISDWEGIEWKSPHQLSTQAQLVGGEGLVYKDIEQGDLGDCWWLSSVAAVCRIPKFINRIIPSDQSLAGSDYIGAFHFRFWRFGDWVDVVVDDKLPTKDGQLFFARSMNKDEFWISLLEKAYAKIHGTYHALSGAFAQDALEDLTGGLAVMYQLKKDTPKNLYSMLLKACKNESFVCCATDEDREGEDEKMGLISLHAYTVTCATKIRYQGRMIPLVRVRNPWGKNEWNPEDKKEWKGDWSDSSPTWSKVDESEKTRLGYANANDGEWWMNFDDFTSYFVRVTICTMSPDFRSDGGSTTTGNRWYLSEARGSWISGVTAGGQEKFTTNPQYYLELREPDDFHEAKDEPESKGKCAVIIGLMQEYRKAANAYSIGFSVYKAKSKPRMRLDVNQHGYKPYLKSGFSDVREVNTTSLMSPGHYVIVPSTDHQEEVGSYLIRIYTEKKINLEKLH